MTKHPVVIAFPGDEPAYSSNIELLGGRVVAVAFADELERAEQLELQRDELLEALERLVLDFESEIHNEHDGTSMLNARLAECDYARAAIAKAKGQQHD